MHSIFIHYFRFPIRGPSIYAYVGLSNCASVFGTDKHELLTFAFCSSLSGRCHDRRSYFVLGKPCVDFLGRSELTLASVQTNRKSERVVRIRASFRAKKLYGAKPTYEDQLKGMQRKETY